MMMIRRTVRVTAACLGAFVGAAAAAAGQEPAPTLKPPTFTDSTVSYVAGPAYRNPFVASASQPDGADILRHAVEFKHVDAWKYGHNAIEIAIKKSDGTEPAGGGGAGAVGLYAVIRSGVGINRLAGRRLVSWGPLRDIDLQVGLNLETKNSAYAPQERSLYVGPNFQFGVGAGFLNVAVQLRKETNHNGTLGVSESYRANLNVEPVWHIPFRIGGLLLAFDGFADYNTAKGTDGSGRQTAPEFITRPQLKVDISRVVGARARVLEVGVGFEYWHNMFGKSADRVPGAKQFTPVFTVAVHLPLGAGVH
jgi:hypothetical protein